MENPYLAGLYEPVAREVYDPRCRVDGELPPELDGWFLQIGSNPRHAPLGAYHWFDGDGMLHGVALRGGRASYRNRWVRTAAYAAEERAGRALWRGISEPPELAREGGPFKDAGNTDVVAHAGGLYAMHWIPGAAWRLDPHDLRTAGADDFGGTLPRRIGAHAKRDPRTGSLVFLDWSVQPPWVAVGEIDASGRLARQRVVELPGPRIQHDLALTPRWVVLLDLPLLPDEAALRAGRFEPRFRRDLPLRLALVPRAGDGAVRWFEAEPGFVFHLVNAWEENGAVIVSGCRIDDPLAREGSFEPGVPRLGRLRLAPRLHRWRLDTHWGSAREARLDDCLTEFPRTDDRALGAREGFAVHPRIAPRPTLLFDGLIRYDLLSGAAKAHAHPPGCYGGEACFAPRPGGRTGEGWLLVFVSDEREARSELHVIDAEALGATVARVRLPQRVPVGFHTCWAPGAAPPA